MPAAIEVRNLSKRYQLGLTHAKSLRELVNSAAGRMTRRVQAASEPKAAGDSSEFWALRDVSFDVQQGEVIGVIGRNGAGKSTLLKILSRITRPTSGRAVLRGRVASLLEVGTGFHPELTGRENVFLNGTLLGMTKREVARKFDEIVDFAGVEKFIDTPTKRYSSGMSVRLGFAVAAHLEPEILIVDEVLAVGDAEFQRKCLGRMQDVAQEGRTVLFVSHNMATVQALCTRVLVIAGGQKAFQGNTEDGIGVYNTRNKTTGGDPVGSERHGDGSLRIRRLDVMSEPGHAPATGRPFRIAMDVEKLPGGPGRFSAAITVRSYLNQPLFHSSTYLTGQDLALRGDFGRIEFEVPRMGLMPGSYSLAVTLSGPSGVADYLPEAGQFEIESGDFYGTGKLPPATAGLFVVDSTWTLKSLDAFE